MAYPFDADMHLLRRKILGAIRAGSVLGLSGLACNGTDQMGGAMPGSDQSLADGSVPDRREAPLDSPKAPKGTPTRPTGSCDNGSRPESTCLSAASMLTRAANGCGMVLPDPPLTEAQIEAKFLTNGCLAQEHACDGCCNPPIADGEPQDDGTCCYVYCTDSCCGRPFVVDGIARVAAAQERLDWLAPATQQAEAGTASGARDRRIAEGWLADALMEHASVASFARFTLDLLAHGAPAELVVGAQQAALDEVEHAQLCFLLARRFGGGARGPGPLTASPAARAADSLAEAACAALVEGCIGETLAAAEAEVARSLAGDDVVRRALERIARDEQRHAELAWRFVAWAIEREGPQLVDQVRAAGEQALRTLPGRTAAVEADPQRVALNRAGRLSDRQRTQIRENLVADVLRPCLTALCDTRAA